MIYLGEDHPKSLLPTMLIKYYGERTVKYSKSVNNLVNKAVSLLQQDDVTVFIDFAPGNPIIASAYADLIDLQKQNKNNFLTIVPIICLEYYMLQYILDNKLYGEIYKEDEINGKSVYLNPADEIKDVIKLSPFILGSIENKYPKHKTIENRSKHLLFRTSLLCFRPSSKNTIKGINGKEEILHNFLANDCTEIECLYGCGHKTVCSRLISVEKRPQMFANLIPYHIPERESDILDYDKSKLILNEFCRLSVDWINKSNQLLYQLGKYDYIEEFAYPENSIARFSKYSEEYYNILLNAMCLLGTDCSEYVQYEDIGAKCDTDYTHVF